MYRSCVEIERKRGAFGLVATRTNKENNNIKGAFGLAAGLVGFGLRGYSGPTKNRKEII